MTTFVSLLDFGATGEQSQDVTAILQSAINTVAEGTNIELPEGKTFRVTDEITVSKKGVRLWGKGTVYIDDPGTLFAGGMGSSFITLFVTGHGVEIDGLQFVGRNNPFNGINAYVSETGTVVQVEANDVTIQNCSFKWMFGHVLRERGFYCRTKVLNNTVFECSNGLNINGNYTIYRNNKVTWSNGIECCGDFCVFEDNEMIDSHGISIGGKSGPAPTMGCVLRRNTITRVRRGGGITMGGAAYCLVEDNVINGSDFEATGEHGIQLYDSAAANVPGWVTGYAAKCWFRRNTVVGAGGGHLVYILSGDESVFEDNTLVTTHGIFGMHFRSGTNFVIRRNVVDGPVGDINLEPADNVAMTVYIGENTGVVRPFAVAPGSSLTQLPLPAIERDKIQIRLTDFLSETEDTSLKLQHLIDAAKDDALIEVPEGKTFRITRPLHLPRRIKFWGGGTIFIDDIGQFVSGQWVSSFDAFTVWPGAEGTDDSQVVFSGLKMYGHNSPFGGVIENISQMKSAFQVFANNIDFQNCEFRNLDGHVVKANYSFSRINVRDCTIRECASGLQVSASDSEFIRNKLIESGAIVSCGSRILIADNELQADGVGLGIYVGGIIMNLHLGDFNVRAITDVKVLRNIINGTRKSALRLRGVSSVECLENIVTDAGEFDEAGIQIEDFNGVPDGGTLLKAGTAIIKSNLVSMHADALGYALYMGRGAGSTIHQNVLTAEVVGLTISASDCDVALNSISAPAAALFLAPVAGESMSVRLAENNLSADAVTSLVVFLSPCRIVNYGSNSR